MKTAIKFGNLYLGNKMTGIPFFNAHWFDNYSRSATGNYRCGPGIQPGRVGQASRIRPYAVPQRHDRGSSYRRVCSA